MNINVNDYNKTSEVFKALGHPARLCIVKGLIDNQGCNVSFMQNCLNLPQSTISQHLSKLKAANIIEGTRNGLEITYSVVDETALKIISCIYNINLDDKTKE